MTLSSLAIIPSGKSNIIEKCLNCVKKQTVPFEKIVVVAWGENQNEVKKVA